MESTIIAKKILANSIRSLLAKEESKTLDYEVYETLVYEIVSNAKKAGYCAGIKMAYQDDPRYLIAVIDFPQRQQVTFDFIAYHGELLNKRKSPPLCDNVPILTREETVICNNFIKQYSRANL